MSIGFATIPIPHGEDSRDGLTSCEQVSSHEKVFFYKSVRNLAATCYATSSWWSVMASGSWSLGVSGTARPSAAFLIGDKIREENKPEGGTPRCLMLRSLKAITKESAIVTMIFRRASPDPRIGAAIELSSGDAHGLFNFIIVGETVSCQGVTTEEAPPALL